MLFIHYPKCTTCQKAKKWLLEKGLDITERDIKLENPTKDELQEWHAKSGLELKKFFNTSGLVYKDLGLKDTLATMSNDEQFELLATNGMLVKRPIVVANHFVLVGFKEKDWKSKI